MVAQRQNLTPLIHNLQVDVVPPVVDFVRVGSDKDPVQSFDTLLELHGEAERRKGVFSIEVGSMGSWWLQGLYLMTPS